MRNRTRQNLFGETARLPASDLKLEQIRNIHDLHSRELIFQKRQIRLEGLDGSGNKLNRNLMHHSRRLTYISVHRPVRCYLLLGVATRWPPRLVCVGVHSEARRDQRIADVRLSESDCIEQPWDGAATELEYSGMETLEAGELPSRYALAAIGFEQPACLRRVAAREEALNPSFCFLAERHGTSPPDGSAFIGVRQPGAAALDAWGFAILPRPISAQRCHVRCNGMLDGDLLRFDGQCEALQI